MSFASLTLKLSPLYLNPIAPIKFVGSQPRLSKQRWSALLVSLETFLAENEAERYVDNSRRFKKLIDD